VTLALDLFVNGLIFGLFYALMAVGLAMIFGVLKVVNFAHGEFYMVGAYTYVLCALKLGVPAWLARLLAGDLIVTWMTTARGSSNEKAIRELQWEPRYPSWREGFRAWAGE